MLILGNSNEEILISHKMIDRKAYISGVIKAIEFIYTKNNGLYSMKDVIGLKL